MDVPESMRAELAAWNGARGIDLRSWVGCSGSFSLAVGYATVFWPEFTLFEGYILPMGFSETALRGFESRGDSRKAVEWVMNHLHLDSVQHLGCEDISKDKLIALGEVLEQIYKAKLAWEFPDRPCIVEFHRPIDEDDLSDYQLSFWQAAHDQLT